MTLWEMQRQESSRDLFLRNDVISRESHQEGIRPAVVRRALARIERQDRIFQVITTDGKDVVSNWQTPVDINYWSWIPIFSERARNMAIELGCNSNEFLLCDIEFNPGDLYFMHLPEIAYDIVDSTLTRFLMTLPMPDGMPLPFGIRSLVLRAATTALPPCFRALVPGRTQVFSELIVNDAFKEAWHQAKFTGAQFRRLTET